MKRTPMVRKTPLRAKPTDGKPSPKPVKCKAPGCGKFFVRFKMEQKACSIPCSIIVGRADAAKKAARAAIDDRKQTRAQLESLKTIPQLKKEAQREFNRYIRERDRAAGYRCICCDRPLDWSSGRGGAVDAGHYRSTGSADHLRYNEDNCHAQLVACNRYGAGRAVDYRIGLIRRIGLGRVEALESANDSIKWTRDHLRSIRDDYRARANALSRVAANDSTMKEAA